MGRIGLADLAGRPGRASTRSSRRRATRAASSARRDRGETWEKRSDYMSSARPVLQRARSPTRRTSTASTRWTPGCRSPTTAARPSRKVGEKHQARRQPRDLDRPGRHRPPARRLRRRPLRDASTAARPGTSRPTCRSPSSTAWRSTTSKPFYNVYGGTQDNNTLGGPSRTTNGARHHQRRLVRHHRRRRLRAGDRPDRPEHRLRRVAVRRPGALRPAQRRGGRHPAAGGQGRAAAALELGLAADHQPALPHAALLRRQQAVPQRRPRRHLEGGQPAT